jgi:predicted NBD/HSP70 family sugar kinase
VEIMAKTIGVTLSERVVAGLVIDHKQVGALENFPENRDSDDALVQMHAEGILRKLCEQVLKVAGSHRDIAAVGVALPGLIRNGVVEEAPNLPQLKGVKIEEKLAEKLAESGLDTKVFALNDADAVAAGIAANQGKLDSLIRVWTLGIGIGYGRYPFSPGVWEGGHTVVSLDEKERFCGCGGKGHIEGIMGHRAMRLRFLDMEPEEVFEAAAQGDARCLEFKKLWHRALAAGTASTIHMDGPGRIFLTGFNIRFIDLPMLKEAVGEMVKMSPLLSYSFELVEDDAETRVLGSAVAAEQAASR